MRFAADLDQHPKASLSAIRVGESLRRQLQHESADLSILFVTRLYRRIRCRPRS
jgi:hypothetical protein